MKNKKHIPTFSLYLDQKKKTPLGEYIISAFGVWVIFKVISLIFVP